jgi:predicted N-formylglutamate amidohydrolase
MLTFIPDPGPQPPAFADIAGADDARVLVICDHASSTIPPALGDLGLAPADRLAHVAWDIGAAEVARRLAHRLACPAVLAGVSRLVIDCNRQPGDPGSIPAVSCGVAVPGNASVDDAEADSRAEAWFWPYHHRIGTVLAHLWRHGPAPAMVSVHSFTPSINGDARPWHVGVLWNRDGRMAVPVIDALRARGDLTVGDNQPYSGREINYTLDTHAGAAGLPHVSFEIRQDLIGDTAGAERWADILAGVLAPVLADEGLYRAVVY